MPVADRLARLCGALAAVSFVMAVLGFGAALDGYAQGRHPVALLGAHGMPHAWGFNLLGWIIPGVLAALVALGLRQRLPVTVGWSARVGGQMLLLAGLAFAGMGVLPLQPEDLDGAASQLHASMWMVWVMAFIAGTLMFGAGLRRLPGAAAMTALAWGCAIVAALSGFALDGVLPQPVAQRMVFAAWALWLLAALPVLARVRGHAARH